MNVQSFNTAYLFILDKISSIYNPHFKIKKKFKRFSCSMSLAGQAISLRIWGFSSFTPYFTICSHVFGFVLGHGSERVCHSNHVVVRGQAWAILLI